MRDGDGSRRALPRPSLARPNVRAAYHRYSAPRDSSPVRRRNFEVIQLDSVWMGIMGAASTFLPVFLVRLGGGALATGILTTLPALGGLLFGVALGRFLQGRGQVVQWYAWSRFIVTWAYAGSAVIAAFAAPALVVPLVLLLWAVMSLPQTMGQVTFPIVMDGAAGPQGRVDLMGRRWAIMGLGTAIAVAAAGSLLDVLGMPTGYQLVLVTGSVAGVFTFWYSSRIVLDEGRPEPPPSANVAPLPARALLRTEKPFTAFVTRKAVFVAGVRLIAPLLPLYYVDLLRASDGWIGIIAMAQGFALVAGYVVWRRQARRMRPRVLLLTTLLIYGLYPAVFAVTTSVEVVVAVTAIGAFFAAGSDLALFDELMARIPRDRSVTFAGVDYAITNLAGIVAPLAGAALVSIVGLGWGLVAGAAVSMVGFALFVRAGGRGAAAAPGGGPGAGSGARPTGEGPATAAS